jgi:cobalt/nickel transport system permease protein
MHMADALVNPAVGGTFWAASGGLLAFASRELTKLKDDKKIPLMGVMGAFVFAAQMINFSIPGTGSSGHLGGGLMLAILLGSHGAFLTMASILSIQAFFFADGGLLSLGCNIFNLGFFPAYIIYPFLFKPLVKPDAPASRYTLGSLIGAVTALQLGAFFVVLQTRLSGISALPFTTFLSLMLPIHLAIGVVEGLATAAVVAFVRKNQPEWLTGNGADKKEGTSALLSLLIAALIIGGIVSWTASAHPDGLEWAIHKVTGVEELEGPEKGIHQSLSKVQEKTAFLPDYGKEGLSEKAGTTTAGLIGGLLTLGFMILIGFGLNKLKPKTTSNQS